MVLSDDEPLAGLSGLAALYEESGGHLPDRYLTVAQSCTQLSLRKRVSASSASRALGEVEASLKEARSKAPTSFSTSVPLPPPAHVLLEQEAAIPHRLPPPSRKQSQLPSQRAMKTAAALSGGSRFPIDTPRAGVALPSRLPPRAKDRSPTFEEVEAANEEEEDKEEEHEYHTQRGAKPVAPQRVMKPRSASPPQPLADPRRTRRMTRAAGEQQTARQTMANDRQTMARRTQRAESLLKSVDSAAELRRSLHLDEEQSNKARVRI